MELLWLVVPALPKNEAKTIRKFNYFFVKTYISASIWSFKHHNGGKFSTTLADELSFTC